MKRFGLLFFVGCALAQNGYNYPQTNGLFQPAAISETHNSHFQQPVVPSPSHVVENFGLPVPSLPDFHIQTKQDSNILSHPSSAESKLVESQSSSSSFVAPVPLEVQNLQKTYIPPVQNTYIPPPQTTFVEPKNTYGPPAQTTFVETAPKINFAPPQNTYIPPAPQNTYIPPAPQTNFVAPQNTYIPPAPQSNFGAPQTNFLAPQRNFEAPTNFIAPQTNFVAPQTNTVSSQTNFVAPQTNTLTSQTNFVAPQTNFVAPQPNFLAPQTNTVTSQTNFVAPQPNFLAPQTNIMTPITSYSSPASGQPDLIAPQDFQQFPIPQQQTNNVAQQTFNQQTNTVNQQSFNQQTNNVNQQSFNQQTNNVAQQTFNQQTNNVNQQTFNQQSNNLAPTQPNQPRNTKESTPITEENMDVNHQNPYTMSLAKFIPHYKLPERNPNAPPAPTYEEQQAHKENLMNLKFISANLNYNLFNYTTTTPRPATTVEPLTAPSNQLSFNYQPMNVQGQTSTSSGPMTINLDYAAATIPNVRPAGLATGPLNKYLPSVDSYQPEQKPQRYQVFAPVKSKELYFNHH